MGFGMTTILLNLHNAGFFPLSSIILSMGIFYGGIAQIIAGLLEYKAPQRAVQVACGKDTEGLQLAQPLRDVWREKELANHRGEKNENDEIVKLQRAAQRRQGERFVILTVQLALFL